MLESQIILRCCKLFFLVLAAIVLSAFFLKTENSLAQITLVAGGSTGPTSVPALDVIGLVGL